MEFAHRTVWPIKVGMPTCHVVLWPVNIGFFQTTSLKHGWFFHGFWTSFNIFNAFSSIYLFHGSENRVPLVVRDSPLPHLITPIFWWFLPMLHRWKHAHLGDIFSWVGSVVALLTAAWDIFWTQDLDAPWYRRNSYNVPRTFRHLSTDPSSSLSAKLGRSRGGQNEKRCVRSVPDRLRVKERISWHLCRMTSLSVEISCSLTLLSSSDLSHLRSFSWHLFLLSALSFRISFSWHLVLLTSPSHVSSSSCFLFSWHLFFLTSLLSAFVLDTSFGTFCIAKLAISFICYLKKDAFRAKLSQTWSCGNETLVRYLLPKLQARKFLV